MKTQRTGHGSTAVRVLDALSDSQRRTLVSAMQEVERLLQASMIRFAIESPTSADARWCLDQYFAELNARFDAGFDPARSISADARELAAPAGALIIARFRGRPVGCGALKPHGDAPAERRHPVCHSERSARGAHAEAGNRDHPGGDSPLSGRSRFLASAASRLRSE